LKLRNAAIIATVLVIVAGAALISPLFLRHNGNAQTKPKVMLGFSVLPGNEVLTWCRDLSSLLESHRIGASVFIVGRVAEQYPGCISYFSSKIDLGSQTYSYSNLTGIADYALKLQEVQKGKEAVDKAGNIYSRIFRAPFNATDQDIYSLLSRSDILADFSYDQQYNVYRQGQFIKYNAAVFDGHNLTGDSFMKLYEDTRPNIIFFDNTQPISVIEAFLSSLDPGKLEFVNASELVGFSLTDRGAEHGDRGTASN
jgi:peptidoglycan/xylan/chitin deacetylase (PgdA/CDA1 family)